MLIADPSLSLRRKVHIDHYWAGKRTGKEPSRLRTIGEGQEDAIGSAVRNTRIELHLGKRIIERGANHEAWIGEHEQHGLVGPGQRRVPPLVPASRRPQPR